MKRVLARSLEDRDGLILLDDEPFTGIGYYLDEQGRLEAEVTYQDGARTGPSHGWWDTGGLSYEYDLFRGVYHGKKREWHRNGQLAEESEYELGIKVRHKLWDEDGELIEEGELDKNHPDYARLDRLGRAD